ncbi:MAG: nuclear transport factor 2 family protein [Chloroflexi bacterium]|nr:nuclear transport factor 2 family protein [Chloroflexota bacterium]
MADTTDGTGGSLAERIDRLDALDQIRQLASRYALALDTRNLDDMVALFVDDVRVGREGSGREELKRWFTQSFSTFKTSIHFVGNHVIDFDDADHARGVVYCRDELDRGNDEWMVGVIQYWDAYVRRDGRWYFVRRRLMRWYAVDALSRPAHGADMTRKERAPHLTVGQLPEAWPSWDRFWQEVGQPQG